jgi:hypothetical protein
MRIRQFKVGNLRQKARNTQGISHIASSFVLFSLVFFVAIQCSGGKSENESPPRKHRFAYDFSNTDFHKIGRKKFDDGSEQSVTSICRFGNNIYVTDPVHSNVKLIDAENGTMKASNQFAKIGELSDVLVIDSSLYVVSTTGFLIVLNLELQVQKSIKLPLNACSDLRFLRHDSAYYIFCPGEILQDKITNDVTILGFKLNPDLSFEHASLSAGTGYGAYSNIVQGYELLKGDSCLRFESLIRCVDGTYPVDQFFPTTRMISLTSTSLSFFQIEENEFVVYAYDW